MTDIEKAVEAIKEAQECFQPETLEELRKYFPVILQSLTHPKPSSAEALVVALKQWKMYSEIQNGYNEDLDTAEHAEGQLYRHCKAAIQSALSDDEKQGDRWA